MSTAPDLAPVPATGRARRILAIYGTRPEAVKLAPVVRALADDPAFEPVVAVSAQHRSMLDQVNHLFGIEPDFDLDIMKERQSLGDITTRVLTGIEPVLASARPDAVLVQGDTTTTFAGALAAFYHQIPVVHLEAGLRTFERYSPFPEEINRRLTTQLATLHLAPTATSRHNLLAEGVAPEAIVVTGNTVIDALLWTVGRARGDDATHQAQSVDPRLPGLGGGKRPMLLVTAHRRESWGAPMEAVGRALARLAEDDPMLQIVLPVHMNPAVRSALLPSLLGRENVIVTEPLPYVDFCRLMDLATVVLTDSGGIQEEAPSLGKPVLVMRDSTERPEAVAAGTVLLVGTDENRIVASVQRLLHDPVAYAAMARAVNPYGDGEAARRSVAALRHLLLGEARPDEFGTSPVGVTMG